MELMVVVVKLLGIVEVVESGACGEARGEDFESVVLPCEGVESVLQVSDPLLLLPQLKVT